MNSNSLPFLLNSNIYYSFKLQNSAITYVFQPNVSCQNLILEIL